MKMCKVKDCNRKTVGRGYCNTHYKQWYRHGKVFSYDYYHGMSMTPFYNSWRGINERVKRSKTYIQKNISVCIRWKNFHNFKEDMYETYLDHCENNGQRNTTIERINNNKGYSPKNCRWATTFEQGKNKSNSRIVRFRGKTKILSEWARQLGLHHMSIHYRIKNWGIKKALITPKLTNKTRVKYGKLSV